MTTQRVIPQSKYYSGQGQIIFAKRDDSGRPYDAYAVGNAPTVEIQVSTTQVDHKESMSGQRATDLTLLTEKSATANITIESLDLRNLASSFYGEVIAGAGGTVTGEQHTDIDSSKGGLLIMAHPNQSDTGFTITTGSAVAVPAGAYIHDPEMGTVQWNPEFTPAVTGTVTVAYTYEAGDVMHALTVVKPPELYVRFQGINTITDELCLVEIPRAQFQPLQSMPLINEEVAQVQLTATLLPDNTITVGSKFYRQQYITPQA